MSKSAELDVKVKFGLRSFITVVAILLAVLIFVGVLTFVIPAGSYTVYTTDESKIGQPFYQYTEDESLNKQIVIGSYRELADGENTSRLPVWRWLTSPFEALIFGVNSTNMIMIIALLVVLGGMAVFGRCTAPSMKRSFGEDPRPMRRIALGMTVVLVLGAVAITFASMYDQNGIYSTGFANKSGNQITQEIVDAFLN